MRLERETFGPVLRAARERHGVTLEDMAAETKLPIEMWADLEENNLSRWPRRVYARSYIRDYAARVGLEPEEVVNDFCRLFPEWGDRRTEGTLRRKAEMLNHELTWEDLPGTSRRRASDRAAAMQPGFFGRNSVRIIAALLDSSLILGAAYAATTGGFHFWPAFAMAALGYHVITTWLETQGLGVAISERLVKAIVALPARRRLVSRTQSS